MPAMHVLLLLSTTTYKITTYMLKMAIYLNPNVVADGTNVTKVTFLSEGRQEGYNWAGLFLPFDSDGFVSLMGGDKKVPVKILHDTAASDSFIQLLVLPFLKESDTGCLVPLLGMGMKILQVHTSGCWRASNIANWGHYICVGKWLCRRSRLGWSSAAGPAAHPKNSQLKVLVGFVFPCDPRSYVVRSNCSL